MCVYVCICAYMCVCIYMYVYIHCYIPLFVTLKKVYDRNVVNKYLLLGVIIFYLIDYMYV